MLRARDSGIIAFMSEAPTYARSGECGSAQLSAVPRLHDYSSVHMVLALH